MHIIQYTIHVSFQEQMSRAYVKVVPSTGGQKYSKRSLDSCIELLTLDFQGSIYIIPIFRLLRFYLHIPIFGDACKF